ncbi:Hint domain-containing protein [Pseudooceanicola nanhaiensis]|uniref:Hint domain-containing protein n=1 Tax=Pseudooceanicola nanhaiensis TaxID=375761 RepID=UPI001CD344E6|nr:Hint domain-containing protein [Pseudooceanicola nanhaiensis]MCA0919687.1 Hint domain-containing protein [Pseudooceanicola nanhaiensis]
MKPKTVQRADGLQAVSGSDDSQIESDPAGLIAGTLVLTMDGELPVEFLSPGDRIISRDFGMSVITSMRVRKVTARAVKIAAGSLGHTRPEEDTLLPAGQKLLVRDWRAETLYGRKQAAIPAARLVDGHYVTDAGETEMRLYELRFEREQTIYAGGMEILASSEAKADLSA